MLITIRENCQLQIEHNARSAWIEQGRFGEIDFLKTALFRVQLMDVETGEKQELSSFDEFSHLHIAQTGNDYIFSFSKFDIQFIVKASVYDKGICWFVEVSNSSNRYSIVYISYPTPVMTAEYYDLFLPHASGRLLRDAGKMQFCRKGDTYVDMQVTMGHYAVYGKTDGIYLGFEDERSMTKKFDVITEKDVAVINAYFCAINVGRAGNSFQAAGTVRWEYFKGDWYDATLIYADFVYNHAKWLPAVNERGRLDTADCYKDVAYWVCDYIPNNAYQRDNAPKRLSAGSDIYEKDYWYKAVITLQQELNLPIAYHVYNWHSNPFNIEYPHYLPAKDGFEDGLKELKKHQVLVFPYINAVSWEMNDHEGGHAVTFANTGVDGAVVKETGGILYHNYPQTTISGINARLAPVCPSFSKWHDIINAVVKGVEEYEVDGVYFDQVAALTTATCYNPKHNHLPGGGSYWIDGYNQMMEKIRKNRPERSFYFTESNAEVYMKQFDGFLTWVWLHNDEVPAFPLLYAGYVEMIGRNLTGQKKDDDDFFKYSLVKMFLYGQQLGWGKADVVYNPLRIQFLKKIVPLRYRYNALFHYAKLMRPPTVECDKPPIVTTPAVWYCDDIVMEQVHCGAWKAKDDSVLVVFVFNINNERATYRIAFNAVEYGLEEYDCPSVFVCEGETCVVCGELESNGYQVFELRKKA